MISRLVHFPRLLKDPESYLCLVLFVIHAWFLRATWRGKIGFRRHWLSYAAFVALGVWGAWRGWEVFSD
jgi:hypothetical protein